MNRRLMHEKAELMKTTEEGVFFNKEIEELNVNQALVVPCKDTIYKGTMHIFNFKYPPSYPMQPPEAKYVTTIRSKNRIHPNYYGDGKVCLSILGTWGEKTWNPCCTLSTILIQIRSLFQDNPITFEPNYESTKPDSNEAKKYTLVIRYRCIAYAVIEVMERIDIYPGLAEAMIKTFRENIDYYRELLDSFKELDGTHIHCFHNSEVVEYGKYKERLERLIARYEQVEELTDELASTTIKDV